MSSALLAAVVGGSCGLVGAVLGSVIGPAITFRLNDKTRKLDLYRVVYPIKVEAAQSLMKQATVLFDEVHSSECGTRELPQDIESAEWMRLGDIVSELESLAWSLEWVLGIEVKNAIADFISDCNQKIMPPREDERCEFLVQGYGPAYRRLAHAVRSRIHLPELEDAMEVKSRRDDPLSPPREA